MKAVDRLGYLVCWQREIWELYMSLSMYSM